MKRFLPFLVLMISFISCDKEKKPVYKGNFILIEEPGQKTVAILQTDTIIFGVELNDKAFKLHEKVKAYKKSNDDLVKVEVTGETYNKKAGEKGWPVQLRIEKIINP